MEGIAGRLDASTLATLIRKPNRYFVLLLAGMALEKNAMSTYEGWSQKGSLNVSQERKDQLDSTFVTNAMFGKFKRKAIIFHFHFWQLQKLEAILISISGK